jgi:ATP-binding cassette subfamily B (MDR/TAP) protein 1
MTGVASVFIFPIFFSVYLEAVFMEASNIKERAVLEGATKTAVEAISNIRTVNSLNQEKPVMDRYIVEMQKAESYSRKKALLRGLIFGLGKSVPNFGYGRFFMVTFRSR